MGGIRPHVVIRLSTGDVVEPWDLDLLMGGHKKARIGVTTTVPGFLV
jgi:hypothetical protein